MANLETLLISKAELIQYLGITKNMDKEDFEPRIREAQQNELRNFVGPEFYYDLVANYNGLDAFDVGTPTQTNLVKAWFGEAGWAYDTGRTRQYFGLRPCLIYWAYAKIVENIDFRVTAYGNRLANHEYSDRATREAVSTKAKEARSMALLYAADAQEYFDKHTSDYTLWKYSNQIKKGVTNFVKITGE